MQSVGKLFKFLTNFQSSKIVIRGSKLEPRKQYTKKIKNNPVTVRDVYLQTIGSGAIDQPSTLLLYTPNCYYLFNCAENTGRYTYSVGLPVGRVEHVFVTQPKWNCIGGLTTIVFGALARTGQFPKFHGPGNLFRITQRMTFLSVVGGLFKNVFTEANFNLSDYFEDENVRIDFIKLRSGADEVYSYFCKVKGKPGSFSLEKSVAKNVPPGEMLKKIFKGEDITLEDGTIVRAEEVRHSSYPDKYFLGKKKTEFVNIC